MVAGTCEHNDEQSKFHKVLGISRLGEKLLVLKEGLSFMDLVTLDEI